LEGFFVEQSRRHAVVESSHDTRLRVAGNDLVRTIPLPQRLARARLYEAQRSRDELQEKTKIEGEPGRMKRAQDELEGVVSAAETGDVQQMMKRPEQLERQNDEQRDAANGKLVRIGFDVVEANIGIDRRAIAT